MDNLLVTLIVGLAVAYIFKTFYKKFKKGNKMDCGCSGCDTVGGNCKPISSDKVKKEVKASMNEPLNCEPKRD
ncbi:MAG: FeoB-associated Cys-rich membrane protein [Desulfobacterales bacterium]